MRISKYLVLVALAALLLSACSSADGTPTHTVAAERPTATDRPPTSVPENTPTLPSPTDTTAPEATATEASPAPTEMSPAATDTPEPQDPLAFLEVKPGEWVKGPSNAPVTIVEYADFQ